MGGMKMADRLRLRMASGAVSLVKKPLGMGILSES